MSIIKRMSYYFGFLCFLVPHLTDGYVLLRINKPNHKKVEIDDIINRLISSDRFSELADQIAEKAAVKFRNFKNPLKDTKSNTDDFNDDSKTNRNTKDISIENKDFDKGASRIDEPLPDDDREPETYDKYSVKRYKVNGKYYQRAREEVNVGVDHKTIEGKEARKSHEGARRQEKDVVKKTSDGIEEVAHEEVKVDDEKKTTVGKENENSSLKNVRLLYYKGT